MVASPQRPSARPSWLGVCATDAALPTLIGDLGRCQSQCIGTTVVTASPGISNAWDGLTGGLYSPRDRDDRVAGRVLEVDGAWTSPRGRTHAFTRPILCGGDNHCTTRQVPAVSPGAGSTASRSQEGAAADLALALVASDLGARVGKGAGAVRRV